MKFVHVLAGLAAVAILGASAAGQAKDPPTRVRFISTYCSDVLLDATFQEPTLDTKPRRLARQTAYSQTTPLRKVKHPGQLEINVSSAGQPLASGTVPVRPCLCRPAAAPPSWPSSNLAPPPSTSCPSRGIRSS